MRKTLLITALLATGLGTSVFAFEQEGVKDGNNRLALSAMYYQESQDGQDEKPRTLYIFGSFSRFFTDSIEAGVGLSYSLTDPDTDADSTISYTAYPFVNYNFDIASPTMVPYVGAGLAFFGFDSGDGNSDTNLGWNTEAGLKMFITEMAAFTPAVYYQDNGDFGDQLGLKVGVEIYF